MMHILKYILGCMWCCIATANVTIEYCQQHSCKIVIDAGSSGSRLHVYGYDQNALNQAINITELYAYNITPGFATINSTATDINAYLTQLFATVTAGKIPIYFYATAGMRNLSSERQQQDYTLLHQWFTQQNLNLIEARTLSGVEEGMFGWLTVNYQAGTFTQSTPPIAVMDVGGMSTQITFAINDTNDIQANDYVELNVYSQHYTLFTHSFLGLGINDIGNKFQNESACFSKGYILPNGSAGSGDTQVCYKLMINNINEEYGVNKLMQPILTKNLINNWVVLSAISYMAKHEPFTFIDNKFTIESWFNQTDLQSCQQTWTDLHNKYPNNKYLFRTCLNGIYYYALAVNGYGLNPNQEIHYALSNGQEPDWTLGVLLAVVAQ